MTATREGSDCPTTRRQLTEEGARDARDRAKRRGRMTRAYSCEQCGCYHLGNTRRSDKRKSVQGR